MVKRLSELNWMFGRLIVMVLLVSAFLLVAFVPLQQETGDGFTVVINWSLVTSAAVIVAWLLNEGLSLIGLRLSEVAKKATVFVLSVAGGAYFALQQLPFVPPPAEDPFAFAYMILSIATGTFKAAQEIYDHLWRRITGGVAKMFRGY